MQFLFSCFFSLLIQEEPRILSANISVETYRSLEWIVCQNALNGIFKMLVISLSLLNVYKVSVDLASIFFNIFKTKYIHPDVSTSNWDWYKKPGWNSKDNSLVTPLTLLFQTYLNQNGICPIWSCPKIYFKLWKGE